MSERFGEMNVMMMSVCFVVVRKAKKNSSEIQLELMKRFGTVNYCQLDVVMD